MRKVFAVVLAALAVAALATNLRARAGDDRDQRSGFEQDDRGDGALPKIDHIVVIYQENWSFDSLFGFFPGANGIANAVDGSGNLLFPQVDKSGLVTLVALPPVKGPDGKPDPRFPSPL